MEYLNWVDDDSREKLKSLFFKVMKRCYDTLGENAFRIPTDSGRRRPVSMTLFESLFYFVTLIEEKQRDVPEGAERKALDDMLEDAVFLDALTYNVDSAVHVQNRFDTVEQKCKEIMNA